MPPTEVEQEVRKHLRYNVVVNLLDGAFFGLGLGFSSFSTFIVLFVSKMTDSPILFGLVPAIHSVGWQLPQLATAGWVAKLRRYKPVVLLLTIHERIPFLGLAIIAWFLPRMSNQTALILTFLMLVWQGLGGGFTANPWTTMITKIIPAENRGTFLGAQSSALSALMSVGLLLGGFLLEKTPDRYNFSLLFLLTCVALLVSWIFLALTREPVDLQKPILDKPAPFWKGTRTILRRDQNFRWFLVVRLLTNFSSMGSAFYIIYGVQHFHMNDITAGIIAATLTVAQIIANPLMGWAGDRWGHRRIMIVGALASMLSGLMAWFAPSLGWFYPIMILTALANVAFWTIGMAMMVEFGSEEERPVYIGMANTLVAPVTILIPIIGGWLAEAAGYQATFLLAAALSLVTAAVLYWLVEEARQPAIEAAKEPT